MEGLAIGARLHMEYDVLDASCQERYEHHIWQALVSDFDGDKRWHASHAVRLKLAMLTPYVAMMRATAAHREAQQERRHRWRQG